VPSHGTNRGSNPLRDANEISWLWDFPWLLSNIWPISLYGRRWTIINIPCLWSCSVRPRACRLFMPNTLPLDPAGNRRIATPLVLAPVSDLEADRTRRRVSRPIGSTSTSWPGGLLDNLGRPLAPQRLPAPNYAASRFCRVTQIALWSMCQRQRASIARAARAVTRYVAADS
jgi:hypothetical protein